VPAPPLSQLGTYVRQHDPDGFLTALLAPPALREDFFTLLAFQHEIATIRAKVTEPLLGRIRLQWWREALEAVAAGGKPPSHEVLLPLAGAVQAGRFMLPPLDQLLEAHEKDFEENQWADLQSLGAHATAITWPVFSMQLALGGISGDQLDGLRPLALGMGLIRLLGRGHIGQVPAEEVASAAEKHLWLPRGWRRSERRLLTPVRLAKLRLQQYRYCHFNRDDLRFHEPHPWRGLTLARAALFG
jgi:phytoene synthase